MSVNRFFDFATRDTQKKIRDAIATHAIDDPSRDEREAKTERARHELKLVAGTIAIAVAIAAFETRADVATSAVAIGTATAIATTVTGATSDATTRRDDDNRQRRRALRQRGNRH